MRHLPSTCLVVLGCLGVVLCHPTANPENSPEFLGSLLARLHPHLHPELEVAETRGHAGVIARRSPQDPNGGEQRYGSSQSVNYPSSNAYSLHQARLQASLGAESSPQGAVSSQRFGFDSPTDDGSLQRQALLNAQAAAQSFRSSYQSGAPRQLTSQVKLLQPSYQVAETPQISQYSPETESQRQGAIQQLYSPQIYQTRGGDLQTYQQQASLAEQAALAFQQAIQRGGQQNGARPRLLPPQYILEQQHSYTVPDQPKAPETPASSPEQYNLAALQQAYQQIETAQQRAVEDIQSQEKVQRQRIRPQRPLVTTEQPLVYDEGGVSIGQGDGFEFAKQPITQPIATVRQPIRQPIPVQQVQQVQQQVQPIPVQSVPRIRTQTVYQPQEPTPVRQPQRTRVQSVQVEQPVVQIPQTRLQPLQYTATPTPAPEIQYTRPTIATQARTSTPEIQYIRTPTPTPEIQYVRTPITQQYTPTPREPQLARTPTPDIPTPTAATTPLKVGNIDVNLLRSLYAAAEALQKAQKDEVNPISEDDLIKALLAQGRREQQAAEILQSAVKSSPPAPEEKDIEVVHIPKSKSQRPITQEELEALIRAGYDVRPVDEPKLTEDPIRQQYLRQAEFLEKQAQLRSLRERGTAAIASQLSRKVRNEGDSEAPTTKN